MGDFQQALTALLGRDAPNLSPSVIAHLIEAWQEEHGRRQRRDLSARRYVYIWADGVYLQAQMEPYRLAGSFVRCLNMAQADARTFGPFATSATCTGLMFV
jgi:hypothetical protein